MESRTSNLSAQMCRNGDYSLRHGRASKYVFAQHVPPLNPSLIRHPQHFLVVCGKICVQYPGDKGYLAFEDSSAYFDHDFPTRWRYN